MQVTFLTAVALLQGACGVGGEEALALPLRELGEEPALGGGVYGRRSDTGRTAAARKEEPWRIDLVNE